MFGLVAASVLVLMVPVGSGQGGELPAPVVLSDDGGWCWFEDPRAVIVGDRLVVGAVANGRTDPDRKGDIEAIVHDPRSGATTVVELHDRLQADDHNSPAFLPLPDGRLLAAYAKHGNEAHVYLRTSEPDDPTRWGPVRVVSPSPTTRLTYSNLARLEAEGGRVYDFFRGLDGSFKPSYMLSDDDGDTWTTGGVVIHSPAARPYVRYASDGDSTIHLVYTEGHPRDFDNSLYHAYYREGMLHRSDGSPIRSLAEGLRRPDEGTRIFDGDPDHVAWPCDLELDAEGRPVVVYSVQVESAGVPTGQGGGDLRYRYARWDGSRWVDRPLCFAGSRLYAGEDDYSGLASIDPDHPDTVYLATDADPSSGAPLVSASDGRRHYELFRARTPDGGDCWSFTPMTRDSTVDQLRPIVPPRGEGGWTMLLWLRGTYRSYTDYDLEVVARPLPRP